MLTRMQAVRSRARWIWPACARWRDARRRMFDPDLGSCNGRSGEPRRRSHDAGGQSVGTCHNYGVARRRRGGKAARRFCRKTRMSASLKIGLMGYGFAGATFHAPVIEHCGRASVAAIATSQPERALADYPHAKIVGRSRRAARARRNRLRRDRHAQRHALRPGAPHAGSGQARGGRQAGHAHRRRRPHARRLALARGHAVRAVPQPSLGRRFPDACAICSQAGELGRITQFESHFDRFRPEVRQRWREEASRGGGLLFDLGPHLIDQALALFGAPQTVFATVRHASRSRAARRTTCICSSDTPTSEVVLHASALTALGRAAIYDARHARQLREVRSRHAGRSVESGSAAGRCRHSARTRRASCVKSTAITICGTNSPPATAPTPIITGRWRLPSSTRSHFRFRPRMPST